MPDAHVVERAILVHAELGPAALAPLVGPHPRSSVYRSAKALERRGLLARAGGGLWKTTPAGLTVLRGPAADAADAADARLRSPLGPTRNVPPGLPIPALDLMPTPVHRSVAELVVLAAGARRRHPRHHLSVVMAGPPLRAKTWLMLALCRLLGADPSTSIVHGAAQTAGGLGARRDSRGGIASVRDALSSPLLAIDEFQRASAPVRRATQALLHGERALALENDAQLEVEAVVILGLNPTTAGTLEERLGLDPALIRRAIVADFAPVALPAGFDADGEERLDKIAALGRVTLPDPPRSQAGEERALREALRAALAATLDTPDRLGQLDLHALGQLAVEASAWVAMPDAVRLVLQDVLTVWETLAWTREGWRGHLDVALAAPGSGRALAGALPTEGRGEPGRSSPAWLQAGPAEASRFCWESRMQRIDAFLRARGLAEPEDLAPALDLAAALEEHGLELAPEDAGWLARVLRVVAGPGKDDDGDRRLALLTALDKAKADPACAAVLVATARELGWRTRDAAEVLRVVAEAAEIGVEAGDVSALTTELARLGHDANTVAKAMVSLVTRAGTAQAAVERTELRVAALGEEIKRREARVNDAKARIAKLEAVLRRASEDPDVAPWLSVTDAKRAKAAYEAGRLR